MDLAFKAVCQVGIEADKKSFQGCHLVLKKTILDKSGYFEKSVVFWLFGGYLGPSKGKMANF